MIRYSLRCQKKHVFEAWFRSGGDFDVQSKKNIITCPTCGSSDVEKSLMAPNVAVKGSRKSEPTAPSAPASCETAAALPAEVQRHVLKLAREIRQHVTENAENVGDKFADEARKIHYQESEDRGIYGKATPVEAHDLTEEGIDVHPLPPLPEDNS